MDDDSCPKTYVHILLDWAQETRPFWIACHDNDLVRNLVEPFLTYRENRSQLRLFQAREGRIEPLRDTVAAKDLPSGKRVVFSLRDSLPEGSFSALWLLADRTPMLTSWRPRLHGPFELPKIFGPAVRLPMLGQTIPSQLLALPSPTGEASRLLAVADGTLCLLRLDGNTGHCSVVWVNGGPRASVLHVGYAAGSERLLVTTERQVWRGRLHAEGAAVFEPVADLSGPVVFCTPGADGRLVYGVRQNDTTRLFIRDIHNHQREVYLPIDEPFRTVGDALWNRDGSLLVLDSARKSLGVLYEDPPGQWHTRALYETQAFELHIAVDAHGVLYVLDPHGNRLRLYFDGSSWVCRACGRHLPRKPDSELCPEPSCLGSGRAFPPGSCWIPWVDFSLSEQVPTVRGPLAVDECLNVYLGAHGPALYVFSMSRRDVWGKQED
uniref:Uncharacterized protein n=1 Tax=Desulfacinum infernum TaxID=35837 RepID=A0A831ZSA8_9BACT